jgi:hypothetical protein
MEGLESRIAMSLGSELQMNIPGPVAASVASATSSSGSSVNVWIEGSGGGAFVWAQRLSRSGLSASKVGMRLNVAAYQVSTPSVAMDAKGDFVVAWSQVVKNGKTTVSEIMARRFDANTATLGKTFAVTKTQTPASDPHVAEDATGGFVIAYTAHTGMMSAVNAELYDSNDDHIKSIAVANSSKFGTSSSVAMTPGGKVYLAYEYAKSGTNSDIYFARYTSAGADLGANPVPIATSSTSETTPSVSVDNYGNAVVAYRKIGVKGAEDSIDAKKIPFGGSAGSEITIGTYSVMLTPTVAVVPSGAYFIVAYATAPTPSGDFFSPTVYVTTVGPVYKLTTLAGTLRWYPAISVDDTGHFQLSDLKYASGNSTAALARFGL